MESGWGDPWHVREESMKRSECDRRSFISASCREQREFLLSWNCNPVIRHWTTELGAPAAPTTPGWHGLYSRSLGLSSHVSTFAEVSFSLTHSHTHTHPHTCQTMCRQVFSHMCIYRFTSEGLGFFLWGEKLAQRVWCRCHSCHLTALNKTLSQPGRSADYESSHTHRHTHFSSGWHKIRVWTTAANWAHSWSATYTSGTV